MSSFILGETDDGGLVLYKTRSVGHSTIGEPDVFEIIIENGVEHKVRNLYGVVAWNDLSSKIHRECGPALTYPDGTEQWYYHGKELSCTSQEEFERLLKLKAFW